MKVKGTQKGAVTVVGALFLLITIALMVGVLHRMTGSDILNTVTQSDAVEALFIAETGVEHASYVYANNGGNCPGLAGSIGVTNAGRGSFDVISATTVGTDCRIRVEATVSSAGAAVPNPAKRIILADLRLSTGGIVAVGDNGTILRWNGTSWVAEVSNTTEDLMSVYCPSMNRCWAGGTNGIIQEWDGTTWSQAYTTNNGTFNSIECVPNDPSDCYAVGVGIGFKGITYKLVRHWNGINWSNTGNGGGAVFDHFNDISCPDTNCYAVTENGEARSSAAAWAIDSTYASENQYGIDCFSADDCWAVGDKPANNTFKFYRRDASGWSATTFNDNDATNLRSVSCADSSNCKAVGLRDNSKFALVSWDGTNWTDESTNLANAREDLNSVHCIQPDYCWAVGNTRSGRSFGNSLFWDGGAWSHFPTPVTDNLNSVFAIGTGGGGGVSLVRWEEPVI